MPEEELALSEVMVRVRFAPSPTGFPHLGNIRTALFNWLFARHHGGIFILRIEDTDVARMVEGATQSILHGLEWLGLDWDEGPIFQSQRLDIYRGVVDQLLKGGMAYHCFCSPKRLEEMRQDQMKKKQPPGYDRNCRTLTQDQKAEYEASGITPVVRFKSPLEGKTSFHDLLRGEIVFENSTLDDFVLLKSDGYPTYHLANIVDDRFMEISHVLRADEWLSSTPRHILLYNSLGWQPPQFAHLPMILGPDKSKLSKRHGATAVVEYEQQGYLPEALFNFLALLGWALDDKTEIMSSTEIVKNFSLDRVSTTAAVFNREKLEWMNGIYIRNLTVADLSHRAMPFLERGLPSAVNRPLDTEYIKKIMPLVQERAKTLAEIPELIEFFFNEKLDYEANLLLNKLECDQAINALEVTLGKLERLSTWNSASLEDTVRPLADGLQLKTGVLFGLLRVAVTGRTAAPPLFQTMEVLGKELCIRRLQGALAKLKG